MQCLLLIFVLGAKQLPIERIDPDNPQLGQRFYFETYEVYIDALGYDRKGEVWLYYVKGAQGTRFSQPWMPRYQLVNELRNNPLNKR